jgi:hypothetical protein
MRDFLTIGSSPLDESCSQVGSPDYPEQSRKECRAFLHQLKRQFGEPPIGASLVIKSFPHDFGEYREVCVSFEDSLEEAVNYTFKLEGETPANWDEGAKQELLTGKGG